MNHVLSFINRSNHHQLLLFKRTFLLQSLKSNHLGYHHQKLQLIKFSSSNHLSPSQTIINYHSRFTLTNKARLFHSSHQHLKHQQEEISRGDQASKSVRENIYTLPNLITSTRILLCPVLAYTIIHDQHLISSLVLFYCASSDWLDGRLARMYPDRMASVLGTILDPAADKILITTLVLSLTFKSLLPVPLAGIIIGRDLLLSLSAFYFRYQSLPLPKTFSRFWDFSLPSAQVKPTLISKYNTFLQLILIGLTIINPILPVNAAIPISILQWTVAGTTIGSGVSYIFSKDAIRYIR